MEKRNFAVNMKNLRTGAHFDPNLPAESATEAAKQAVNWCKATNELFGERWTVTHVDGLIVPTPIEPTIDDYHTALRVARAKAHFFERPWYIYLRDGELVLWDTFYMSTGFPTGTHLLIVHVNGDTEDQGDFFNGMARAALVAHDEERASTPMAHNVEGGYCEECARLARERKEAERFDVDDPIEQILNRQEVESLLEIADDTQETF